MIALAKNFEPIGGYVEYAPAPQAKSESIRGELPYQPHWKKVFNVARSERERRANAWYRARPASIPVNCGNAWKPLLGEMHCLI